MSTNKDFNNTISNFYVGKKLIKSNTERGANLVKIDILDGSNLIKNN